MEIDDNQKPFYRGHEGFFEILKDKILNRPGRAIRVYNYSGPSKNEKLYVIGTDKQLFDTESGNKVEPKDVLNKQAAPDGWSVEGLELMLLPEEEMRKLLE